MVSSFVFSLMLFRIRLFFVSFVLKNTMKKTTTIARKKIMIKRDDKKDGRNLILKIRWIAPARRFMIVHSHTQRCVCVVMNELNITHRSIWFLLFFFFVHFSLYNTVCFQLCLVDYPTISDFARVLIFFYFLSFLFSDGNDFNIFCMNLFIFIGDYKVCILIK